MHARLMYRAGEAAHGVARSSARPVSILVEDEDGLPAKKENVPRVPPAMDKKPAKSAMKRAPSSVLQPWPAHMRLISAQWAPYQASPTTRPLPPPRRGWRARPVCQPRCLPSSAPQSCNTTGRQTPPTMFFARRALWWRASCILQGGQRPGFNPVRARSCMHGSSSHGTGLPEPGRTVFRSRLDPLCCVPLCATARPAVPLPEQAVLSV